MFYNNLKRLLFLFLTILLTNTIVATQIRVVTINEDFASITKEIGGDLVHVSSLVKGSRNIHNIIPKPSMVMKVKKADLLIRLGMGQDSYVDSLIQVAKNKIIFPNQIGYIDASKNIKKLDVPTGKLDGRHGDIHKYGNPHYWLNPRNGIVIAQQIKNHLIKIDPQNADIYERNTFLFAEKLSIKINEWEEKARLLKNSSFITYHKTWDYLFDAFNLDHIGELEPLPGIPPSVKHLTQLKKIVLTHNKDIIILNASYFPTHDGKTFAAAVNGKFVKLSANVGEQNINKYIDLFDTIFNSL